MFIYLLPPSEGKNIGGIESISSKTFAFELPIQIASSASPKDLKCKGDRYEEGMKLNRALAIAYQTPTPSRTLGTPYQGTTSDGLSSGSLEVLPAIHRYSGVMYKAIGYDSLTLDSKEYFDEHVLILSGMYGLLRPQDMIANYKLPIDTKGLRQWRGDRVTDILINYIKSSPSPFFDKEGESVMIIDLLSGAYQKMLDPKKIRDAGIAYVTVNFLKPDGSKYTHGVKKVKGEWLREWCKKGLQEVGQPGDVIGNTIEIVV